MSGVEEAMRSLFAETMRDTMRSLIREELSIVRSALTAPRTESPRTVALEQTFTTAEVATHLRCDVATVAAYCNAGKIAGRKVGRHWIITQSALDAYEATRGAATKSSPAPGADDEAARLMRRLNGGH